MKGLLKKLKVPYLHFSGIGTWQYVKPIFYDVKQELITITSCSNLNGTRKTKHFPEQISKTGGNNFSKFNPPGQFMMLK